MSEQKVEINGETSVIEIESLLKEFYTTNKDGKGGGYGRRLIQQVIKLTADAQRQLSAPNTGKGVWVQVSYPTHDKVVLTRTNGDTYTSKGEELLDFFLAPETSSPISVGDGCRTALQELVYLKSIKDIPEYKEEYERRKPLAWAAAKKAVASHEVPPISVGAKTEQGIEAVEFALWIADKGYLPQYDCEPRWVMTDDFDQHTTTELYNLYKSVIKL